MRIKIKENATHLILTYDEDTKKFRKKWITETKEDAVEDETQDTSENDSNDPVGSFLKKHFGTSKSDETDNEENE